MHREGAKISSGRDWQAVTATFASDAKAPSPLRHPGLHREKKNM